MGLDSFESYMDSFDTGVDCLSRLLTVYHLT